MDIITGYTGTPHITAENDRDINIGIFGSKSYVLQTGTMLTAEISNNNEIKVRDGVIMHQGCAASIKKNTYDSVTINNGSQGMKRIDLIVARYEKQPETNVESLTLKVLQGTPAETSPQVPAHTEGDIQAGDTVADMPLYEVEIDGLNITEIRKVFQMMEDLESVNGNIISVEHKDIGLHAVDAGSYTDIPVDLKQFEMSKIISVIPILQGRSSSPNYGLLTLGLYEFNQNTATLRVFNADGSKREPRINVCVIGFKQL
jgi:hypothetical protein